MSELLEIITSLLNPGLFPFVLMFLAGYIVFRVTLKKETVDQFSQFEKILIGLGIGLLLEYTLFLPTTLTLTYFFFVDWQNVLSLSTSILVIFASMLLLVKLYPSSERTMLQTTLTTLEGLMILMLAVSLFGWTIGWGTMSLYDTYIVQVIGQRWNGFAFLNILSLFMLTTGSYLVMCFFLLPVKREYRFRRIELFKPRRRKIEIAFVLCILVFSLAIVPIDVQSHIFSPKVVKEEEHLFTNMGGLDSNVLFIFAERQSAEAISNRYQFYSLMQTSFNITLPRLLLLVNSVYLRNPSNTSFGRGEDYPHVTSTDDWKKLWVNVPTNVSYKFITSEQTPVETKVEGIEIALANYSGRSPFSANLTYWQQVSEPLINITYFGPTYVNLGNNTWIEQHTYIIENTAEHRLLIPAFQFDRFNYAIVNRESVKAYYNGSVIPYAEMIWQYRLSTWTYVQSHNTLNFTVTFLAYDIS